MSAKELYTIIGQRVRDFRDLQGVTQAQIATETNINRATISNIESGKQQVSIQYLYLIAKVLNTEISTFLPSLKELNMLVDDGLSIINEQLDDQEVSEATKNSILQLLNKKPENDK